MTSLKDLEGIGVKMSSETCFGCGDELKLSSEKGYCDDCKNTHSLCECPKCEFGKLMFEKRCPEQFLVRYDYKCDRCDYGMSDYGDY